MGSVTETAMPVAGHGQGLGGLWLVGALTALLTSPVGVMTGTRPAPEAAFTLSPVGFMTGTTGLSAQATSTKAIKAKGATKNFEGIDTPFQDLTRYGNAGPRRSTLELIFPEKVNGVEPLWSVH